MYPPAMWFPTPQPGLLQRPALFPYMLDKRSHLTQPTAPPETLGTLVSSHVFRALCTHIGLSAQQEEKLLYRNTQGKGKGTTGGDVR